MIGVFRQRDSDIAPTKPKVLGSLSLVVVSALTVAVCSSPGSTPKTSSTTSTTEEVVSASTTEVVDSGPAPVDGGTFRVGLVSNITTANWFASLDSPGSSSDRYLMNSKVSLYAISLPGFALVPGIAATEEPVAAYQADDVWVVEQPIRDDLVWSDGVPVTAHDLAYYFDVTREFGLGGGHADSFPANVRSVTAPEEHLVRIEFESEPRLTDWQIGVGFASFVPAHFWQPHVEEARSAAADVAASTTDAQVIQSLIDISLADENPETDLSEEEITPEDIEDYRLQVTADQARTVLYSVTEPLEPSAGPIVFDHWVKGVLASTRANPTYFERGNEITLYSDGSLRIVDTQRDESAVFGGRGGGDVVTSYVTGPFVSDIEWIENNSRESAYEQLAKGEVDFVWDPNGISIALRDQLAVSPELRFSVSQGEGVRYLAFNLRKAPLSDLAFRQAVATIVDKELVADTILAGAVFPAYTMVHPELGAHFNRDVERPGWSGGAPMPKADRFFRAMGILRNRGYTWETDPVIDPDRLDPVVTPGSGLTMPNGIRIPEMTILAPGPNYDPFRATYSEWIGKWLNELGIPATVESADFEAIISRVFPPQTEESALTWDMYVLGWGGPDTALPGASLVGYFHSSEEAVTGGGLNTPGYSSDEFDSVAQEFLAATDLDVAADLTKEMDAIIARDLPYVILFRPPVIEAFRAGVTFPTESIMGGHGGYPGAWPGVVSVSE